MGGTCEGPGTAELSDHATLDVRSVAALEDVVRHLLRQFAHFQLRHVVAVRGVDVVAARCDDVKSGLARNLPHELHVPTDAARRVLHDATATVRLQSKF